MKKLLSIATLFMFIAFTAPAQEKETKAKVKKTSTIPQKVHNVFSKNKKYKGTKAKVKTEKTKEEKKEK